jgi:hypothetical protein
METTAEKFAAAHNRARQLAIRCGGPVPPVAVVETREFAPAQGCSCAHTKDSFTAYGSCGCNWCGGLIALSQVVKIGDLPPVPRW